MDKSTVLLAYAKRELPGLSDDPFGDAELFERETVRYFAVEGAEAVVDPKSKTRHRLLVKTDLFGWTAKHIDWRKFEEAKKWLENDISLLTTVK